MAALQQSLGRGGAKAEARGESEEQVHRIYVLHGSHNALSFTLRLSVCLRENETPPPTTTWKAARKNGVSM